MPEASLQVTHRCSDCRVHSARKRCGTDVVARCSHLSIERHACLPNPSPPPRPAAAALAVPLQTSSPTWGRYPGGDGRGGAF
eukprot:358664-Chlamydomonas_euryale.AAC.3